MKIKLIAVGTSMPKWVEQGYHDYSKRLPPHLHIELIQIPLNSRHKNVDLTRVIAVETKQMLSHINPQDHVIALDINGMQWDTKKVAEQLAYWQTQGQNIVFLIGGPEGFSQESLERANQKWSLSPLTFPHPLVRVLLAEQLYRASTILANHPYHRG